jgi:hypothetical protein
VPPRKAGRTWKKSSCALDVRPFIVCLAVVQYEQIDLLGKRSDRPLSRTVQHGESGEIFHERFENVGHWKIQADLCK